MHALCSVPLAPQPNPNQFFVDRGAENAEDALTKPIPPTGILHTIFFLRYFPSVLPMTRDVLGLELAYVPEAEIETLIDQRVAALVRQLESERHQPSGGGLGLGLGLSGTPPPPPSAGPGSGRGQITVQFFEKRRRKTWYNMRGDDEVCWESWTVKVTVAEPRTESGMSPPFLPFLPFLPFPPPYYPISANLLY